MSNQMTNHGKDVVSRYEHMIYDVAGMDYDNSRRHFGPSIEERLHAEAEEFYDLFIATSEPIWPNRETHAKFSSVVRMLSIIM